MKTALLIGPASSQLGQDIAAILNWPSVHAMVRAFPDGECCVSCEIEKDIDRIIIIQGTHAPQDRHLQQLYQMVEVAAYRNCREIICLVPYLAYARQDYRDTHREPLSARIVLDTLAMLGATQVVSMDVHNPRVYEACRVPLVNLSAAGFFTEYLISQKARNIVIVSPDRGGEARAQLIAKRLNLPCSIYDKHKSFDGSTWYADRSTMLADAHAVVIDDLCSSGSTLMPLAKQILADGARQVSVCITHMLADTEVLQKRLGIRCRLLSTDSIPTTTAHISLAPLFVEYLRQLDCVPA